MSELITNLKTLLEPAVQAQGCVLWGIEYLGQGRHSVLRIYIDAESGVTVDLCAAVSHQLSAVLDVNDPISGEYTLEVSSPGLDRPLFTADQYRSYIGGNISVRMSHAHQGRRKVLGVLTGVTETEISVNENGQEFLIPVEKILRSHVVPKFE